MQPLTAEQASRLKPTTTVWLRGPHLTLAVHIRQVRDGKAQVCAAGYPYPPGPFPWVPLSDLSLSPWPGLGRQEWPILHIPCLWHPQHKLPYDLCPHPDAEHTDDPREEASR